MTYGGNKLITVKSYFSGAGGMDLGLLEAGLEIKESFEIDRKCCNTLRQRVTGNVTKELNLKTVIHDYKTADPEIIITSDRFFPDLIGVDGVATTHIKIQFCPICGRN